MRSKPLPVWPVLGVLWAALGFAQAPESSQRESPQQVQRPDVSDAQLGLEVQARLYQELQMTSNISALVRYGVVTLDGRVRSENERDRAVELARNVPGIEEVDAQVVFDPVWNQSMMSEAAKLQLGMM